MLKQRLLTAGILLPLLLAAIFFLPNDAWSIVVLLAILAAGHEWARLSRFNAAGEALFLIGIVLAAVVVRWFADPAPNGAAFPASTIDRWILGASVAFWCIVVPCWLWFRAIVTHRAGLALAGLVVLLPTWLAVTRLQEDPRLLLWLLGVIWISDTAAYFTGRALGRRKLAPAISPGKTWEGVAGAFLAVAVYALVLGSAVLLGYGMTMVILAFAGMTALGILGDLYESWLKRCAKVKDSGTLLPGHGGMLDRIDALTAAMPLGALVFLQP